MNYILSQICGILICIGCAFLPHFKKKAQMLTVSLLTTALSLLSYLLLGEFAATGVNVVAMVQVVRGIQYAEKNTRFPLWEGILFSVLFIAGGLLPYLLGEGLHTFGWRDTMPIIGAQLMMCAILQKKEQHYRIFALFNALTFLAYNILIGSTQLFAQLITALSILSALIRYYRQEKRDANKTETIKN